MAEITFVLNIYKVFLRILFLENKSKNVLNINFTLSV